VYSSTPTLTVYNTDDPDGPGALVYGFSVYGDPYFTDLITAASGIEEGTDSTSWTVDDPLDPATYWWRAYADDGIERGPLMPGAAFTVEELGTVPASPSCLALGSPQPNPVRAAARITFDLPSDRHVHLAIYDCKGRLVRTLLDAEGEKGRTTIRWNGSDHADALVANGLYVVRLEAGGSLLVRPMVVLR
jgi:hypothetical protein